MEEKKEPGKKAEAEVQSNKIIYNQKGYKETIDSISSASESSTGGLISLFLGRYTPHKQQALDDIANASEFDIQFVETSEYVTASYNETVANIDELFEDADAQTLFYFINGDKLCGVYTGFTQSKVKYATPHERYLFNKIKEFEGALVLDIANMDAVDESLLRVSDAIIYFPLPKSPVQRFLFGLKNYSFHGYEFRTKRPKKYVA